jgi:hypothetical protein
MKKDTEFEKVLSSLEPEGQGRGIIMGVTRLCTYFSSGHFSSIRWIN